jgi:exopolysaccharide biosynthesis polyprenyl glycosylphosphotransferase
MYRKRNQLTELIICLTDVMIGLFSLTAAGLMRYGTMRALIHAENLAMMYSVMSMLHVAVFYFLKVFDGFYQRGRYKELLLSVKYHVIVVAVASLLSFAMKNEIFVSRLVMGYFCVLDTFLIWAAHLVIRNWGWAFRKGGRKQESLLVVTTRDHFPDIVKEFSRSKEIIWEIVGVVLLDEKEPLQELEGIPVVSEQEDVCLEYATLHVVDEVFIQLDDIQKKEGYLKHIILEFEKMGVVVNLNLDLFNLGESGQKRIYSLGKYNVVAFASRLFDYRMVLLKRLIDIIGALFGLALTLVVGIILAPFLLLESPGPLIFRQERVGVNGRIFHFYKFRSMYVDAEKRKAELMEQNEMNGLMFKMENDPRVTKVGAFIRKTSIDELPQFWNVLKGDMSLVGTRPPTVDEYQQYNYYQKRRISFRPGITGLWQVSGRSDITDFDEVVKLDLEYIDNWSLALDLKIILKTVGVVFGRSGAK